MKTSSDKPLQGNRILVVEDQAFIALDLINGLNEAGAEIIGPAMSLERALEAAISEDLDCAVLDVMMHDGLVFPAASILRERGAGIVYYTGYYDLEALKRDWPSAQALFKPAPAHLLVRSVKAACSC
jgi:CheY-like chemotaxis protein